MTDRTRQNWSIVGQFSTVIALLTIGAAIWNLAAGFTTATRQHEQLFQQNAQIFEQNAKIFQLLQQNSDEQLKALRRIEEKLDRVGKK